MSTSSHSSTPVTGPTILIEGWDLCGRQSLCDNLASVFRACNINCTTRVRAMRASNTYSVKLDGLSHHDLLCAEVGFAVLAADVADTKRFKPPRSNEWHLQNTSFIQNLAYHQLHLPGYTYQKAQNESSSTNKLPQQTYASAAAHQPTGEPTGRPKILLDRMLNDLVVPSFDVVIFLHSELRIRTKRHTNKHRQTSHSFSDTHLMISNPQQFTDIDDRLWEYTHTIYPHAIRIDTSYLHENKVLCQVINHIRSQLEKSQRSPLILPPPPSPEQQEAIYNKYLKACTLSLSSPTPTPVSTPSSTLSDSKHNSINLQTKSIPIKSVPTVKHNHGNQFTQPGIASPYPVLVFTTMPPHPHFPHAHMLMGLPAPMQHLGQRKMMPMPLLGGTGPFNIHSSMPNTMKPVGN